MFQRTSGVLPTPLIPVILGFLLLLIIDGFASTAISSPHPVQCPAQCICEAAEVVCSCDNSAHAHLRIDSFGALVIDSLTIHSCESATLSNGSFTGVTFRNRLSILGVANLTIEPYAFRNLQQAPKIFLIDSCSIGALQANAFSGLSHLDHIWIKNSHISSVHSLAFSHLSNVRYLYIHRVTIGTLHAKAFGGMFRVQHIFLRSSIKIDSAHSFLFADSFIDEIVFDGVEGKFSNLFLSDHEASHVAIRSSRLSIHSKGKPAKQRHKCVNPGIQLLVTNSTIDNFESTALDFYRIDIRYSTLGRLRAGNGPHSPPCPRAPPATSGITRRLSIDQSMIDSISESALNGIDWDRVEFNRTRVNEMQAGAFHKSKIGSLILHQSTVSLIGERAFNQSIMGRLHINDSQIGTIARRAFAYSRIDLFSLHSSTIQDVLREALSHIETDHLIIDRSRLELVGGATFRDAKIALLSLSSSSFGIDGRSLLSSFSPRRLSLTHSSFSCNLTDCPFNNLLLSQSRDELEWHFSSNSCEQPLTSVCRGASATRHPGGALCTRKWRTLECTCEDTTVTHTPPVEEEQSVLIMGDCPNLEVDIPKNSTLDAVYLFRTQRINVLSLPSSLDTLHVYHSYLRLRRDALTSADARHIYLADCHLTLDHGAIADSSIDVFVLERTRIRAVHRDSLLNTRVARLRITESRARSVGALLAHAREARVERTVLAELEPLLTSSAELSLANNTQLCGCCKGRSSQLQQQQLRPSYCLPQEESARLCYNYFGGDVCTEENSSSLQNHPPFLLFALSIFVTLLCYW